MLTSKAELSFYASQPETLATSPAGSRVCAVILTHGDRQRMVRQVMPSLLGQTGVWKIVLVSNGALWNVQALVAELGPERIEVVELETNQGPGAAFAAGIQRACDLRADFVWLLDDDNKPREEALSELLAAYARLSNEYPKDRLAVLGFRPDHQGDVAVGVPLWRLKRRTSSFLGFHVFDLPYKFWCRTPWGRPRLRKTLSPLLEVTVGPNGGLLFHRSVVDRVGLPRSDFVLYGEDTEFTYRITSDGGALRLVTSAVLVDLEESWRGNGFVGSALCGWLKRGSDLRVFYGARNQTYLDSYCFPHSRSMYWVNRQVYCFALWLFALIFRRSDRYRLLRNAIRDGQEGRLGMHPDYPL